MGCAGSKKGNQSLPKPDGINLARKIKIWGDYFNSDTRVILAVCKMQGVEFEF
jgi:hypothetical protein